MNSVALAWDVGADARRFSKALIAPFLVSAPQVDIPTTASEPAWLRPTLAAFANIAGLEDDWDGRGSAKVRQEVLSFALRSVLAEVLPPMAPAPAVIPLGHGGIQLIWNTDAAEIEVEVVAPYEVVAYRFNKATGDEHEELLSNDLSNLADVMWAAFKS
jgi:hypothetical protein